MCEKNGIEQALEMFDGSPTKLADAVGGSVIRQHIEHWKASGLVPMAKAPAVALATGIPVEVLNPSVNWDEVRSGLQVAA